MVSVRIGSIEPNLTESNLKESNLTESPVYKLFQVINKGVTKIESNLLSQALGLERRPKSPQRFSFLGLSLTVVGLFGTYLISERFDLVFRVQNG